MNEQISEELWQKATAKWVNLSDEDRKMFDAQIAYYTQNKDWKAVKMLLQYVAGLKTFEQ